MLPDRDDREGGIADGVGACEGEDFVELFADGGFEGAVAYAMDEGDLQAFTGNVGTDDAAECVELELELLALGDISAARKGFDVEVNGECAVWRWLEGCRGQTGPARSI